jgi:hypothetical protein
MWLDVEQVQGLHQLMLCRSYLSGPADAWHSVAGAVATSACQGGGRLSLEEVPGEARHTESQFSRGGAPELQIMLVARPRKSNFLSHSKQSACRNAPIGTRFEPSS